MDPASWVKTCSPTIGFESGNGRPEARATSSESGGRTGNPIPVATPDASIAAATSARAALPARSPQTVDGDRQMRCTGGSGHQRVGGGQAEIVVGMELQRQRDARGQIGHKGMGCEGVKDAQCIGDAKADGARGRGDPADPFKEIRIGPAGILSTDRHRKPRAGCSPDKPGGFFQKPGTACPQFALDLPVGSRNGDVKTRDAGFGGQRDILMAEP